MRTWGSMAREEGAAQESIKAWMGKKTSASFLPFLLPQLSPPALWGPHSLVHVPSEGNELGSHWPPLLGPGRRSGGKLSDQDGETIIRVLPHFPHKWQKEELKVERRK